MTFDELKLKLADDLAKELTISKTELSASRAKKTSASDERKSSQSIGYVGLGFLVVVIGLIIISDLNRLFSSPCCVRGDKKEKIDVIISETQTWKQGSQKQGRT